MAETNRRRPQREPRTSRKPKTSQPSPPPTRAWWLGYTLRVTVALVIVLVWTVIYLRAAFTARSAPPEITLVMLLAVVFLFGYDVAESVGRFWRGGPPQ